MRRKINFREITGKSRRDSGDEQFQGILGNTGKWIPYGLAQLSQRGHVMLTVVENFAVTQSNPQLLEFTPLSRVCKCTFLSVFYCNYGRILYRFVEKARY